VHPNGTIYVAGTQRIGNTSTAVYWRNWGTTIELESNTGDAAIQDIVVAPDGSVHAVGRVGTRARHWENWATASTLPGGVGGSHASAIAFTPDGRMHIVGHNFDGTTNAAWYWINRANPIVLPSGSHGRAIVLVKE